MKIHFDEEDLLATAQAIPRVNIYAKNDTPEIAMAKIRATAESCWGKASDTVKGHGVSTYGVDLVVNDVVDDTVYVSVSISPFTVNDYFNNLDRIAPI